MKIIFCKRNFSLILSLVVLFQLSNFGLAIDIQPYTYDELPDDEILCYCMGYPVYKENINSNFRILWETLPVPLDSNIPQLYQTGTIRTGYRGETIVVRGRFQTYQYAEDDTFTYLPNARAEELAEEYEDNGVLTAAGLAATIAGPFFEGTLPTLFLTAACGLITAVSSIRSERASAIRAYTDAGDDVLFICSSSRFGTFWYVNYWDGATCIYSGRYISDGYDKRPGMPDYGVPTYSEVLDIQTASGATSGIVM